MNFPNRFILGAALCAGALLAGRLAATTAAPASSPDEALARLTAGNHRFVTGQVQHPNQDATRRAAQEQGQTPFAIVLTCADSRVAPEMAFDQGIGDLFVIRNAGHVLDDHVIGSIEYAVAHLHVGLVVVLGHAKCGAVAATVAGGHADGHIASIVESIRPALASVKDQPGDAVDNTVRANSRRIAAALAGTAPVLGAAVQSGQLKVVAGRYDLASGRVEFLP